MKIEKEQLLQNAPCGYLQMGNYGKILAINNTLRNWLGYKEDEHTDLRSIEDLFSMGGKVYYQTHMMPLLQMHGEVSEINITMVGKNSVAFPALINAKMNDPEPNMARTFSVFVINMTQRKMYENELLNERKKAEDAIQRLKQINIELEQFAYTVSHDLQSPLRTTSAMIQLLEKKNIIEPDSEGGKLFSLIKSNSDQMRGMINDLLDYTKVDDNSAKYTTISLKDVCNKSIELLKNDIEKNGAIFHIVDLPNIQGSKPQLVRLFQNLFENSIKYRSEANPIIVVTLNKTHNYYYIHVSDNGIGFKSKYVENVFSFMKRLHTNEEIPGSGIGLSTCRRIMENHGGAIRAESEPGEGTVFKLQFPREVD